MEAFNFFGHSADRLNVAELIDGSCKGQILADRDSGNGRKEGAKLDRGGGIAVDGGVRLLEAYTGRYR